MEKCTLIGVYSKHLCTVLCGIFSPCDADIVFTGSADHSVHSWRLSKDLHNHTTELKSKQMLINISYYLLMLDYQIYNTLYFLENQDTPNVVKERIVTKDAENTKTGIYLVFTFLKQYKFNCKPFFT